MFEMLQPMDCQRLLWICIWKCHGIWCWVQREFLPLAAKCMEYPTAVFKMHLRSTGRMEWQFRLVISPNMRILAAKLISNDYLKIVTTSQPLRDPFLKLNKVQGGESYCPLAEMILILTKALIHEAGLVPGISTKQFALHHPPQAQASLFNLLINDLCRWPCNFIWLVDAMDCWAGVGWLQHSPWSEVPAFWNIYGWC